MSMLADLLEGYIYHNEGWSVAGQFRCTFDESEDFEDQNSAALEYILKRLIDYTDTGILSVDSEMELEDYTYKLKNYLDGQRG